MPVSHRRAPRVARDATVYTNAPIRRGEALIAHLCTLLRSQGHSQPKLTAQQCTQTPQFGAERPDPPIRVHYYGHTGLPATQQCTQTPQSSVRRPLPPICVHSCDPKAIHNPSSQPNSVHKRPNSARRGPILSSVYTLVVLKGAHCSTVYTNAPIRRLEALTTHLCTLLRSLAPQESRQVSWSNMSSSSRTWSSSRRRARW